MNQGYLLQTILSCCINLFCRSLKCVLAIRRKDLIGASMSSMFCVLWRSGEGTPELAEKCKESLNYCHVHGFNCNKTWEDRETGHTLYLQHHNGPIHGIVWCVRVSQEAHYEQEQ